MDLYITFLNKIDGTVQATLVAQACSVPPEGRCKWTVRLLADRLVELEIIDAISHTAVANALKKTNLERVPKPNFSLTSV